MEDKKIKVSVAMATYNGEKFLREQLESLYAQTRVPDEIVVVDDCSTDRTLDILKEYHEKKGLIYYINESNQGVNCNFFKAISKCIGDYVAISDQDDIWFPNKIEESLNKITEIEKGRPAVVSSLSRDIDANGNIIGRDRSTSDTWKIGDTLFYGNSQGCSLMMNRKLINLLKPITKETPIYDWIISNVAAISGIKYNIGNVLMYYRHHSNNVMARINVYRSDRKSVCLFLRQHALYYKYDALIPSVRVDAFNYLIDTYSDIMSKEAYDLIIKTLDYQRANIWRKWIKIGSFPIPKKRINKIRKGIILYGLLPFKKK